MSFYDDASWLLIPEGIEEDIVFAQKPTSGLGDLQFTRASDATRTNSAGVIERTPWNLLQFSEQFDNAAWTKLNITITSNEAVSPTGTLTADKVVQSVNIGSDLRTTSTFSLVSGNTYTWSIYAKNAGYKYVRLIAWSSDDPVTTYDLDSISVVSESGPAHTSTIQDVGNGWRRLTITRTVSSAVGWVRCVPLSTANGSGTPNNIDGVYLWGAQVVEGTDAKPYFATTNRQDVPRLDYRNADGTLNSCPRLLLEPQRTNSIRNSTMVGSVAGSPGTLPTNWTPLANALTQTVVGLGTENGLQYIDLRYNGISTNIQQTIAVEGLLNIAATTGQTWSFSTYVKLISGTFNSLQLQLTERSSGGGFVTVNAQTISPTSSLNRFAFTQTLNGGATTIAVQPNYRIGLTIGATYDFTIRIAAPQMELGAYATTWVPTTTAAVTRIADAFTRNNIYTNGLISAAGGTWFVDLSQSLSLTRDTTTSLYIGDNISGTLGNAINIRNNGSLSRLTINKTVLGILNPLYTTLTDNLKIAIKWNGSTADVFVNGSKVVTATSFTTTLMENLASGSPVPFYINQMLLAPTPLSDAECIERTTL